MSDDKKIIKMAPVESLEEANRARRDKPFFTVLPRPQYPDCNHHYRGITLNHTTRTAKCLCGQQIDLFDALMIYAHAEQRLISTKEDIERREKEATDKKREQEERKPFLREIQGYGSVYNPAPPEGDGALIGYDVSLSCGHHVRWPSRGRRIPKRHLTCDVCVQVARAKSTGQINAKAQP